MEPHRQCDGNGNTVISNGNSQADSKIHSQKPTAAKIIWKNKDGGHSVGLKPYFEVIVSKRVGIDVTQRREPHGGVERAERAPHAQPGL